MPEAAAVPDAVPHVVVFGDVIDDIIVTPVGDIRPDTDTTARIERRPGGSAANAAAWFAHLGCRTDFFGRVGASDVEQHSALLRADGVVPHLRGEAALPTGTIVVVLQPDRTRTMLTERGANALVSARDVDRSLLGPGRHLHFTGYSLFSDTGEAAVADFQSLIQDARAAGSTVSVNPGSAGFLADHGTGSLVRATQGATAILPNLDEGRLLTGREDPREVVAALLERYELVTLTMGRAGVLAAMRGVGPVTVPAIPVVPIDTTGAGDAFSAGFLTAMLRTGGHDEERLIAAASEGVRCAALVVESLGARPPRLTSAATTSALPSTISEPLGDPA
ncbi:PfkB family carbohydrate kinase [Herbiconiux sp. 11R-BC]|uniref:carbohydrate kinase family protein n=1 Tax=Herbiconiux sp. 11R-BC TaxID=3111637 RepID=UPI003C00E096